MQCVNVAEENWTSISGWQCLTPDHSSFSHFSIANMMNYFIHREAPDGNPTNDFKDINNKAFPLFKAKRVEGIIFKNDDGGNILIKASCAAEMKKSWIK